MEGIIRVHGCRHDNEKTKYDSLQETRHQKSTDEDKPDTGLWVFCEPLRWTQVCWAFCIAPHGFILCGKRKKLDCKQTENKIRNWKAQNIFSKFIESLNETEKKKTHRRTVFSCCIVRILVCQFETSKRRKKLPFFRFPNTDIYRTKRLNSFLLPRSRYPSSNRFWCPGPQRVKPIQLSNPNIVCQKVWKQINPTIIRETHEVRSRHLSWCRSLFVPSRRPPALTSLRKK